jgi:hypothetical protein
MRTLFLTTAAFAALVMVAPIGTAHADTFEANICEPEMHQFTQTRSQYANGSREFFRFADGFRMLSAYAVEHNQIIAKGRVPEFTCADALARATAYVQTGQ